MYRTTLAHLFLFKNYFFSRNKSLISVNNTTFSSTTASSSASSFFINVFAILTKMNKANAMIIKSITDWINKPYLIPQNDHSLAKSTDPKILPINGMMIFSTNEDIILLKAAPITTAIAKSKTLPFKANSLNSFNITLNLSFLNVTSIVQQIKKLENRLFKKI